ncbi:MAG: hypothetical protein FWH22_01695 [Fibromonadales bacterium]|nr:hypothetical protein [Fibromonadales bacterium]
MSNKHNPKIQLAALVREYGGFIQIPENLKTAEICKIAVEKNEKDIYFVPESLMQYM